MFTTIIVDYCSMDRTVNCINGYMKKIKGVIDYHFVIVDNSPTNKGLKYLYKCFDFIENMLLQGLKVSCFKYGSATIAYYYSHENLGYAKGNNIGALIAEVLFHDKYFLISNNDLFIQNSFDWEVIEALFETDQRIAVVGPHIVGYDGKPQSPHKKVSSFKMLFLYYWLKTSTYESISDLDYNQQSKYCYRVMGSFMFVKAKTFLGVGGFDENTFLYAEEMILSERLEKKGYRTYFYNDITVVHGHEVEKHDVEKLIRGRKIMFESCSYYFRKYRNLNEFIIILAKLNFNLTMSFRKLFWKIRSRRLRKDT